MHSTGSTCIQAQGGRKELNRYLRDTDGLNRMILMSRLSVRVWMAWLLIGPPALCRAGVLVDCCAHESTQSTAPTETVESPCCEKHESEEDAALLTPERIPRKCGDCAGVCNSVAKPSDDTGLNTLAVSPVAVVPVASEAPMPVQGNLDPHRTPIHTGPPYPPSDLPLLI